MSYYRVNERCNGCLACVECCPAEALDFRDEGASRTLLHNMARCARCATCWRVCPREAVEFQHILENRWDEVVQLPLVRCEVCDAPVHTSRLPGTLDDGLRELVPPLCPEHRSRSQAAALRLPRGGAS